MNDVRWNQFIIITVIFIPALASVSAAIDPPHTPDLSVTCASCHNPGITYTYATIDNTPWNEICWSCHDFGASGSIFECDTHSAISTGDDVAKKYWSGKWTNECRRCHDPHTNEQARSYQGLYPTGAWLYTGTIQSSTYNTITVSGSPWAADELVGKTLHPKAGGSFFYMITDNTPNTIVVAGSMYPFIRMAGGTFAISYGKLIRAEMNTGSYADKFRTVKFLNSSGTSSFADGDADRKGICEVCHTETKNPSTDVPRYRRDAHGDTHFEDNDCAECHIHTDGFKVDLTQCVSCHNTVRGGRRQVVDSNSDGSGTGGDFIKASHHVYPSSGTVMNSDCQACHDVSAHAAGTVRLKDLDTGAVYDYNPADPSTAEPHCLSCHDSDGANGDMNPLSDGKTLGVIPYKMSADIETNWVKTYGHKQEGLTCLGDGTPGTGCHANGHGSNYNGLLSKNLPLPTGLGGGPFTAAYESYYELCFSCHQNYPGVTKEDILGVKAGSLYDWDHYWGANPPYNPSATTTNFKDRRDGSGKTYDDMDGWGMNGYYLNLHYWHLQDWGWSGGWKYRNDNTKITTIHCLTCHNVHGSNTQWGWVYDEMQYKHYAGQDTDMYGRMDIPDLNGLNNYPISCNYNCHPVDGRLENWFYPPNE